MTPKMAGFSYFGFYAVGLLFLAFLTSKVHSISCYVCNSEFDPSCGDPFKPYTIGVLNCSLSIKSDHIAGQEAKLCRKIVQKIQGSVRIYRSCGYIEDSRDDKECIKRSGTHDVQVDYCSCTGDLCNGTASLTPHLYSILTIVTVGVFIAGSLQGLSSSQRNPRDRRMHSRRTGSLACCWGKAAVAEIDEVENRLSKNAHKFRYIADIDLAR